MPILKHCIEDHTGEECWVFSNDEWCHATVIGIETVLFVPFFAMNGGSELPLTPVRLDNGREMTVGCLSMKFVQP